MNSDANWAQAAQHMQETFGAGWQQAMGALAAAGQPAGFPSMEWSRLNQALPPVRLDPAKLQALQQRYIEDASTLWNESVQASADAPALPDRRFSAEAWKINPVSKFSAAAYLLNARTLTGLADAVEGDAKTRARVRFAVEQWMAATAPSNFLALNAEAQQKAIKSQGESIAQGLTNLLQDMKQGHVSMTDESVFEVGKNVATTEGAVVFENEFFQLLEYKPLTAKVYEKPFLLVPPCINKFYILDLQPDNSLIRYAAAQGHR
ncbi:MAG: class I poly(R)-hydroxyalkanoic acid synthase, partial [Polaromonas sp.]